MYTNHLSDCDPKSTGAYATLEYANFYPATWRIQKQLVRNGCLKFEEHHTYPTRID